MRLPAEKIKEAILDPDPRLRLAAVCYFGRSFSPDPTIMPLVIQAFERYGSEAFEMASFLEGLVQSEQSVAWLIRQIERIDPDADEQSDCLFANLTDALRHADAAVLSKHERAIQELKQLDDESQEVIADRIAISALDSVALWRELTEFCHEEDLQAETSDEDFEFGCSVVDALAAFPQQCAAPVLEILQTAEAGSSWLENMAVRLAGRIRLVEAIPSLIDLLREPELLACEDARRALTQLGTDAVVHQLEARYNTEDEGTRLAFANLLEDIHTDCSVQTALRLLEREQDQDIRGFLIRSLLLNFSSAGIELARQHVLSAPKTPDVLEVRQDLLLAAKMLGVSFPEFEAWTEDCRNDAAFRRQWYESHPLTQFDGAEADLSGDEYRESTRGFDRLSEDDFVDGFDDGFEEGYEDVPPETIVRHDPRIGRNDPCPCGSGKKYKKCCFGREVREPEAAHAGAMGGLRPGRSAAQFPVGTVALYGPDDKITTKIVAAVIKHEGAEPLLERLGRIEHQGQPESPQANRAILPASACEILGGYGSKPGLPPRRGQRFSRGRRLSLLPVLGRQAGKPTGRRDER